MIRSGLIPLTLLAVSSSAHAAPRPLGPADDVALGGDAAILARAHAGTITATRAPLDGSSPTRLLRVTEPRGQVVDVAASAERAAVLVSTRAGFEVYAGPATGPLEQIATDDPNAIDVAEDTVFVLDDASFALAPDATRRAIDFPVRSQDVRFAGDFVTYTETKGSEPEDEPALHLRVRNWRTGETVRSLELPSAMGVVDDDLREDGGVLLELDDGHVHTLLPGQALADLGADPSRETGAHHRWAGDGYTVPVPDAQAAFRTPGLVTADGTKSVFGLPSGTVEDLDSDGRTAVWEANGCAVTAPVTETAGTRYEGTACGLTETVVVGPFRSRLQPLIPVRVRCLVARTGRCTGTVRSSQLRRSVHLTIPAGRVRTLRLPVRPAALREARRRGGGALKLRFVFRDGRPRTEIYPIG